MYLYFMRIYYSAFNPERKSLKAELVLWLVLINGDTIMPDEGESSPLSKSFTVCGGTEYT